MSIKKKVYLKSERQLIDHLRLMEYLLYSFNRLVVIDSLENKNPRFYIQGQIDTTKKLLKRFGNSRKQQLKKFTA